jgi:tRNA (guanine37-N1)-methyltransferase
VKIAVLTLFPAMFAGPLDESIVKRAREVGLLELTLHNLRDYAHDRHRTVDDRPFGGGPGMILQVEPVVECVEAVQQMADPGHLILLSPRGRTLNQKIVEELAAKPRLLLLCGRYEGFDERVFDILEPDEISTGDYVLNGGEAAAMVVIDAVIRLIPGVLGDEESSQHDSFSSSNTASGNRLLEFPQYSRPREFRGHEVPEVLVSGNHEQIARWRKEQSYLQTRKRRSDLIDNDK